MKILAIVVTYFPEKDLLLNNVNAFINEVDHVLIWENTPESERIQHRFVQHEKVEYCGDGINSISHALNFGWKYAKDHDYDYLLTMDQDSQWEDFSDFLHRTVYDPEAPEGIWGPLHNDVKPEVMERDTTMTSGMLIKVSLINRIGGWNEFFDIDCVDDEFCLSAKRLGIRTYVFGMCRLIHHLGTPHSVTVLGRTSQTSNYSPKRLYSIYKTHVVLLRMFPKEQTIRKEFREWWVPQIKWTVVCEKNHVRKFFAIFGGMFRGLICRIPERHGPSSVD